jgi:AraC-like DNA-binding protein
MRAKVKYWLAPGMRSVELIAADYGAQRFSPHWHTGFAVGVVTRNAQQFSSGGRNWVIGPGDFILLNPGQVHDGSSLHDEGWSSRMAYVPERLLAGLELGGAAKGTRPLRFTTPVLHLPELADKFLRWHCATEHTVAGDSSVLGLEAWRELIGLVRVAQMQVAPACGSEDCALVFSDRLQRLSHDAPHALAKMSSRFATSRTTLWRHTRARLGLGPQSIMTQLRLMSAKGKLAAGQPVLEVALDAGFHDQSHFTRQFAAAYGMTPAQYRKGQVSTADAR